jgi:hypothetical protein
LTQGRLKALIGERFDRGILINIGCVQAIHVELGWGANWRLIRAVAVFRSAV